MYYEVHDINTIIGDDDDNDDVCIMVIKSKRMDQPGKAVNPAHGQLNIKKMNISYFPVRVRA